MDHAPIRRALELALDRLEPASAGTEFRLVGTAASFLHGVQLPVGDVDILLRDRPAVDLFSRALSAFPVLTAPSWMEQAKQYYASHNVDGVDVALSTVEWETNSDAIECLGVGPWEHFSPLPCGSRVMPTVALELRLVTDVMRDRPDRYRPTAAFLRDRGCDIELVRKGFGARRIPAEREREVLGILGYVG